MKLCSVCGQTKAVDDFHWKTKSEGIRQEKCKKCACDYAKKYRLIHGEQLNSAKRGKYVIAKEFINSKRRDRYRSDEKYRVSQNKGTREWGDKYRRDNKKKVFEHYGYSCKCCGEEEPKFLSIDHVEGDGSKHRKSLRHNNIYIWLVKNGFPSGFQVLCHNCNHGSFLNGGVCPHQTKRKN